VIASEGEGIETLKVAIAEAVAARRGATASVAYDAALEEAIAGLLPRLAQVAAQAGTSPRNSVRTSTSGWPMPATA